MKRHRVTISALGTTGVLLAASLTMLALVSALVTFDAWPQRAGGESPSDIAVQGAPGARLVRAIQPSPAARAAARARAAAALAQNKRMSKRNAKHDYLLRGLRSGRLEGFEADEEALEPWLEGLDLRSAVASLSPRTALLMLHARGDEQIPYTVSEELFEAAAEPKRMLLVPGGHHRSIQHDMELQAEALRFVERAVDGSAA